MLEATVVPLGSGARSLERSFDVPPLPVTVLPTQVIAYCPRVGEKGDFGPWSRFVTAWVSESFYLSMVSNRVVVIPRAFSTIVET